MSYDLHSEITLGSPSAPCLVLIHGVAGSLHIWDPVYNDLAKDYTVIRMDLLGYGYSPKPRVSYGPADHVGAIRSTLQKQGLKPPYTLVGLSMGSTLALAYAAAYPDEVARIIAIGYPYYPDRAAAKKGLRRNTWAGLTINHPIIAHVYVPFVWGLGRVGILPPRIFAGIYSELQARETLLCPYRVFRANVWHSMVDVDAAELLSATAVKPRLFLHAENDEWAPADTVRQAVATTPDTSFIEIPGAGHNLVVLEPAATLHAIRSFLEN